MARTIRIEDLADVLAQEMDNYTEDVKRGLEEAREQTAKEAVKWLRTNSPKKTGRYRKSWALAREKSFAGRQKFIVYARSPGAHLTHLLEKGHAKAGGGRVAGIPHISIAEEDAIKAYLARAERVIKG